MATIEELFPELKQREAQPKTIEDLFPELRQQSQVEQGNAYDQVTTPIAAVVSGLAGTIAGGYTGIGGMLTGDTLDSNVKNMKSTQENVTKSFRDNIAKWIGQNPNSEQAQRGMQILENSMKDIESVINFASGGSAGLAKLALNPSDGLEGAQQTVDTVREKSLAPALGQDVLNKTGSPLFATLGELAPDIASTILGAGLGRTAGRAAIAKTKVKSEEAQKALDYYASGDMSKKAPVEDITKIIDSGTPDEIAAIIDADPNFYKAMDELGISTEPLASYASRNTQFKDVEQALASVPGSVIDKQGRAFVAELATKADNLIESYGGSLDKAQLGLDFKDNSLKVVDDLFEQASEAYTSLRRLIPEENTYPVNSTVEFLESLATKDKLPPRFARILRQLKSRTKTITGKSGVDAATGRKWTTDITEDLNPKLGRIDLIRKEIGQAINKGTGPFKDVETGLNKALYARLSNDMDEIAKSVGGDALTISDVAKGLVIKRKQIEDNLITLLGKDLNGALNTKVATSLKGLAKGEVDKFTATMRAIPENLRGEVALSAMNDVFKSSGAGQQALNPTQFTKWYDSINRSPAAKRALFDNLPKESKKAIDSLYTVSKGVSQALGQKVNTGRINALFNKDTGFVRKMVGKAAPAVVGIATKSPTASAMTRNYMEQFLKQSTEGAKNAADLMVSPEFQRVLRQSVEDGIVDGGKRSRKLEALESALSKSEKYKRWANALGKDERAALIGGISGYLFSDSLEEDKVDSVN